MAEVPNPEDDLESSELAVRLRHLDWPEPGDAVRERCLEAIMKRVEQDQTASGG